MMLKKMLIGLMASVTLVAGAAQAADLAIVSGDTGTGLAFLRSQLDKFEAATGQKVPVVPMPSSTSDQFGQYRLWLAAGNTDIDVYQTDVIWAPQLADQFLDLTDAAKDIVAQHFPSIIESQTVDGKLVALPAFTDAPALFYRKDLLEKHGKSVPTTWAELETTAKEIMDAERAEAGNQDMWGFVFQGNAYEGLTCDALEWVMSNGGGQIIEADGSISINNEQAAAAIDRAAGWVGTIAPDGVLAYQEEESRGVWQLGNSVFMRNWPYAYALGNGDDSAVKGKTAKRPVRLRPWAAGTLPSPSTRPIRKPPSSWPSSWPPRKCRRSAPSSSRTCPPSKRSMMTPTCWLLRPSWPTGRLSSRTPCRVRPRRPRPTITKSPRCSGARSTIPCRAMALPLKTSKSSRPTSPTSRAMAGKSSRHVAQPLPVSTGRGLQSHYRLAGR